MKSRLKKTGPSKKTLLRTSWALFSQYIRKRDQGTCFTCGKRNWNEELGEFTIQGMNAGHFIHSKLDYDEMNINCQCVRCNLRLHGNLRIYTLKLIDRYGREAVNELHIRSHQEKPYTEEYLKEIIELYTLKLKNYE